MAERKIQEYKKESVASLTEEFKGHSDFIFSDYRGMTVEQITDLRKRLRGSQAAFRVVKNNFAKIALKSLDTPNADDLLKGPTAVCYVDGETMPAVKILFEAAKTMPLEVKGGIIDGEVFDPAKMEAFSKLPTKNELIASLMGTMKAPVQYVVYVLDAYRKKLETAE